MAHMNIVDENRRTLEKSHAAAARPAGSASCRQGAEENILDRLRHVYATA